MSLETSYANGQFAALTQLKLAFPAATHPVVQGSGVLQSQPSKGLSPQAKTNLEPPTNPYDVSQLFSVHEQAQSRTEPLRKLSADICTTCRKEKHYGSCKRPIPIKRADFNMNMSGSDPSAGNDPSTSPHYHSATSDSALARARSARPADEQAASAFADLFRHQGITSIADEPGQMTGGLNKVAGPVPHFSSMNEFATRHPEKWNQPNVLRPLQADNSYGEGGTVNWTDAQGFHEHPWSGQFMQPGDKRPWQQVLLSPQAPKVANDERTRRCALLFKMYGVDLSKPKEADWQLPGSGLHSMHEQRGPSVNPYEERLTKKSPPVGWGDEGDQRVSRAFGQIDHVADSNSVGGGFGEPSGGPAVLG